MYTYSEIDQRIVDERVEQYRDQTRRYLSGDLSEEAFLPLRLQNGLYVQRHAPMLRVAIPYGLLSSQQLRKLSYISRFYDKGYAHFTTRQNIQFNWPKLEQVPDILAELASVQMHAIQTSGNCIRNTTTDPFAGVQEGETADPRPWCEIIRQWSTLHPEFAYLPRKFKIAVTGNSETDRAAVQFHDIGLQLRKNEQGKTGFKVFVGGGLGRTPVIGTVINEFLPWQHLLTYLDAILRVYNQYGRRDNKYKARIKILVKAMGIDTFKAHVEQEWLFLQDGPATLTTKEVDRVTSHFSAPDYSQLPEESETLNRSLASNKGFANWYKRNVSSHKVKGYAAVVVTLKNTGVAPGDITATQMDHIAQLADRYSFGILRITHEQNMVLTDVRKDDLFQLWQELESQSLATPNAGLLTDVICCPGGDFCNLANAKSIPVASAIQQKFEDLDYLHDLGDLSLNISGCMNACAHHHIGNIGILGVDKKGEEFYQIMIGGSAGHDASLGKILGRSISRAEVPDAVSRLLAVYLEQRLENEPFLATYRRIGLTPFKERVYETGH
ncbi:nitrite/sulfite reductase [Sansalvadorimonas sp. 2012CJ34-2]|uniref:Nitrite/sulfite reductase n=1 Tax=Parendozoicomonas callyspongiae TaxID=2942213 RepID=A0ABT0PEP5_9GAMM|nr:nitrite/sulfite reductase [Sansalvadorimonas sp. 2012CJ34-2]MCL6269847.1 nitrite/sulfite reductase [Sansalvadorimonas sp. 2012CJ34-2]